METYNALRGLAERKVPFIARMARVLYVEMQKSIQNALVFNFFWQAGSSPLPVGYGAKKIFGDFCAKCENHRPEMIFCLA